MTAAEPTLDEAQRPELHIVPDTDAVVPAETDTEVTGPISVVDADGQPVAPRAPLDVQIRDKLLAGVAGVPAFGRVPASFAESIEYSQRGDWATSDKGFKRIVHGLLTLVAFAITYPFVEGLGAARTRPGPFVLTVLIVAVIVLAAL